jgi:hypothetical protein
MQLDELFWIIQSIDKQIGSASAEAATSLLLLRNEIMRHFKPDNDLDWSIKDSEAQQTLKKIKWVEVLESF